MKHMFFKQKFLLQNTTKNECHFGILHKKTLYKNMLFFCKTFLEDKVIGDLRICYKTSFMTQKLLFTFFRARIPVSINEAN